MKILLVRPPTTLHVAQRLQPFLHLEPLALEIVAGGIDPSHDTRILDLSTLRNWRKSFLRELISFAPDLVGFTAFSNQAAVLKQLAASCRQLLPRAVVMVGGIHATVAPEDLRLPGVIDLIVRGEGATAMRTLLPLLQAGSPLPESEVFLPTGSPRFEELASLPLPALPSFSEVPSPRRDLVDRSRYYCIWHGEPGQRMDTLYPLVATARTSVGCPMRCSFCVVHHLAGGKYVRQTPEQAVEEIAQIQEDHVYFVDDEMYIDAGRAQRIAQLLLERNIRKQYISWARADTIVKHPEMFRLWKKAGLVLLYVGLESMDPATLKDYHKGIAPDENRKAVEILRELGIGLHAALMVRPDFTPADFELVLQTVAAVAPAEVTFTVFSPPPGTELWRKHRSQFICPDPYAFYDCMHTLLPTRLALKDFYGKLALLWAQAARRNPWRVNKVKVPLRDFVRFMYHGMRYGLSIRRIYKDYPILPAIPPTLPSPLPGSRDGE